MLHSWQFEAVFAALVCAHTAAVLIDLPVQLQSLSTSVISHPDNHAACVSLDQLMLESADAAPRSQNCRSLQT